MPIYQEIPTVTPKPAIAPPTPEELRQVFQENVRSTAFCLTLSKRMCAALLSELRFEAEPNQAWATLKAVFSAQRATGRALQERGLLEGRRLTKAGRIVAQLVELAGFTIADFDPEISRHVGVDDSNSKPSNTFKEYVTSTAFVITLSKRMCETLGAIAMGDRHKLNDYSHFLNTVASLQTRGLVWWDGEADRQRDTPWKLTEAGKLVAQLLTLLDEEGDRP